MKIKQVRINNFRGLKDVALDDMNPGVNLFLGINGSGKSSFLDALGKVLSWYVNRMKNISRSKGKEISFDDITINSSEGCTNEIVFDNGAKGRLYRLESIAKKGQSDLKQITSMAISHLEEIDAGSRKSVPVILHYGVDRHVGDRTPVEDKYTRSRGLLDAYSDVMDARTTFKDLFPWYKIREDLENEKLRYDNSYHDRGLDAIRKAMENFFPGYSGLRVLREIRSLALEKDGILLKLDQLSEGEKCHLALVCDIVKHLVQANAEGDPLEGEGIILIDEIDLHLHPQWQMSVVSNLRKTFPNCQFFLTTHSPLVASDTSDSVYRIMSGNITTSEYK